MNADANISILVVDDDSRSLDLMRLVLHHAGYRVLVAPDAASAIDLLEAEPVDLALADLLMPGMTGLELCQWVRGFERFSGMRFVLLTGMDDEQTRIQAQAAGADAVITKPFDRASLLARLASLLQR